MMGFLEHLPDEFKESVKVIRISASDNSVIDVAADVVCWVEPDPTMSGNQVAMEDGVAMLYTLYTAHLLVPNPNIQEGDLVVRRDGEEIRVVSVRPYGDDVMQLILRQQKVL